MRMTRIKVWATASLVCMSVFIYWVYGTDGGKGGSWMAESEREGVKCTDCYVGVWFLY